MARPRTYMQMLPVNLRQIDRIIVRYYAELFDQDHGRIVRSLIRRYAEADTHLDEKEFVRFVKKTILPESKDDPELQEEIRRQLNLFLKHRNDLVESHES